jgi:hypothetical protein
MDEEQSGPVIPRRWNAMCSSHGVQLSHVLEDEVMTTILNRPVTISSPSAITDGRRIPTRSTIAGVGIILALVATGCDSSRPLADEHAPPTDVVVRSDAAFFAAASPTGPTTSIPDTATSAAAAPTASPADQRPVVPSAHGTPVLVIRGEDSMDHRTVFSQTLAWGDDMFAVPLRPGSHVVLSAEISGQPASHTELGEVVVPDQPGHEIDVTLNRQGGRVAIAQLSRTRAPEIADPPNPLLTPFDVPTVLPPALPPAVH